MRCARLRRRETSQKLEPNSRELSMARDVPIRVGLTEERSAPPSRGEASGAHRTAEATRAEPTAAEPTPAEPTEPEQAPTEPEAEGSRGSRAWPRACRSIGRLWCVQGFVGLGGYFVEPSRRQFFAPLTSRLSERGKQPPIAWI